MGVKGKRALSLVAALAIATAACPATALARGGELASQAEEATRIRRELNEGLTIPEGALEFTWE